MKEVLSYKKKLKLLRNLLKKKDCNYYLLPRTDKFQNEFISEEDERVKWLTGFSGSFAFVIISLKQNIIFTDGRYIDQIKKEVDQKTFKILDINNKEPILWLKDKIQAKEKVLLDSWLFSCNKFNYLKKIVKEKKSKILLSSQISPLFERLPPADRTDRPDRKVSAALPEPTIPGDLPDSRQPSPACR